jgi:cell division protein FtsI (penicillin-binding protein 3)
MALEQRRLRLLFGAFVALLAVAALRTLDLGTLQAAHLSSVAAEQQVSEQTLTPPRGTITDRNGIPLALTVPADDISVTPYQVKDPDHVAAVLAPLLNTTAAALLPKLEAHSDFEYLARQVHEATAQRIAAMKLAGVNPPTTDNIRDYPFGSAAGQVLGGVHLDGSGAGGIEQEYNRQLAGVSGESSTVFAADGTPIQVTDPRKSEPGQTVRLTLDARLEQEMDSVLAGVGAEYHPDNATAIALNPNTGALLGVSNWPSANPNDPGAGDNWADNAVALNYEPGSTFKIVVIGGALSDGLISPNTPWNIPSSLNFDTRVINDSTAHGDETLTTAQIIAQSSNIGAVEVGQVLGADRFAGWVKRFGFGAPTGVDLPGEEAGIVPPLKDYNNFSMGNLPFGQGESVTPIQVAEAYAAIANGGILRTPHIVASVGGVATPEPSGHRILTRAVALDLRGMLEDVLKPGGTASEITIPGYELAGKTGTANKAIDGVYSDTQYVASFVGFAPAQNPQIEIEVVVNDPKGGAIFGTEAPAHAWDSIMSWALPYLKIPPA